MLPGPNQIVACPYCRALECYETLLSGNTFGSRFWTDGKQVAPMLPEPPAVVKCHSCGGAYWLEDAQAVGTVSGWGPEDAGVDPAWNEAPPVEELNEDEYYAALQSGMCADMDKERFLRLLAWWKRNDAYRASESGPAPESPVPSGECRRNVDALLGLLCDGMTADDQLMKAELLRHLERFEDASAILSRIDDPEYRAPVDYLLSLCQRGDPHLRELILPGDSQPSGDDVPF